MNREQIYSALFAKLKAIGSFNTVSRKLKHWNDVAAADQPAMFQAQRMESVATVAPLNQVWNLHVDVYVYVNTASDPNVAPSSLINPLIDSIVAALAPDPVTNKCTLGGLVQHAWIEGQIQTDEGVLGEQAIAVIPIVLKVV